MHLRARRAQHEAFGRSSSRQTRRSRPCAYRNSGRWEIRNVRPRARAACIPHTGSWLHTSRLPDADPKLLYPSQHGVANVRRIGDQLDGGIPLQNRGERDLRFELRKGSAEAIVDPAPEG